MKYVDEFRRAELVQPLIEKIGGLLGDRQANLMEVCGTHTVAIFRSGLKKLLPKGLNLISGPGCPVCVTPNSYMDGAVAYCRLPDAIIATFGDMFRVPGSSSSLEKERASGADVRIVYSAMNAVEIAEENPGKKVIFLGVGFETTVPSVAASIIQAKEKNLRNFFVFCGHKVVPPAMEALIRDKQTNVQGFILPGHVSTVIGAEPYQFITDKYHIPSVITGFEPLDVAQGIYLLTNQVVSGAARLEIQYKRSVRRDGNPKALEVMRKVFKPSDSVWRGIGPIPESGLEIRPEYALFDAEKQIEARVEKEKVNPGCICGQVLKGFKTPAECPLFAGACTPEEPVGACMVSAEGTCAAYYKYDREV